MLRGLQEKLQHDLRNCTRHDVEPKKVLCGAPGAVCLKDAAHVNQGGACPHSLEAAITVSTLQTASSRALGQAETRASVPELDHTMFRMLP